MNSDPTPTADTVQKLEALVLRQACRNAELQQTVYSLQRLVDHQKRHIQQLLNQTQTSLGFGADSSTRVRRGV